MDKWHPFPGSWRLFPEAVLSLLPHFLTKDAKSRVCCNCDAHAFTQRLFSGRTSHIFTKTINSCSVLFYTLQALRVCIANLQSPINRTKNVIFSWKWLLAHVNQRHKVIICKYLQTILYHRITNSHNYPACTAHSRSAASTLDAFVSLLESTVVSVPAPTPNAGRFSHRCDQRYPVIMCQTASLGVAIQNMSTNLFAERLFLVKAHREKKISLLCSRTPHLTCKCTQRDLTCHERCSSPSAAQRLTLPQPHSTSPDFNHVSPTILHTITLKVNLILLGITFKGQSFLPYSLNSVFWGHTFRLDNRFYYLC